MKRRVNFLSKSKIYILTAILGWTSIASAATLQDVVNSVEALRADFYALVKASWKQVNQLIYEENPNQIPTQNLNQIDKSLQSNTGGNSTNMSFAVVKNTLLTKNEGEVQRLTGQLASDTFIGTQMQNIFGENADINSLVDTGDLTLSLNTLIGPLAYSQFNVDNLSLQRYRGTKNERTRAALFRSYFASLQTNPSYNFVQYAGSLYQPPTAITKDFDSLTPEQKEQIQSTDTYKNYQAALRAYVAAQSVGASNLYQMMAERIPLEVTINGEKQMMSDLQLRHNLATRRSQNEDWYKQMAQASPTTISRETLFVLAEIREQLFQMQQQNERLLATLSVMELQNTQTNKIQLQQLERDVKAQIDTAKGIQSVPTPASTGITGAGQ